MEIIYFIFTNTNKNNPIRCKQIPRQHKTRVNHTAPVGVEASVCFGILEQAVAVLIVHACFFVVFLAALCEVVTVNKVVACVIRWINIDHLNLTEIALLQEFQYVKVVALDVEILGGVPVAAFFRAGAECLANRATCLGNSSAFAHPSKLIGFISKHVLAKHGAE